MNDGLELFRSMLSGASNRRENLRSNTDSANTPSQGMGGGGGQNAPPFGGGGGGGMDPWQTGVEKRLDSLDRRITSIESDVGQIRVDLATVSTNVSHLPSKGFIVTTVIAGLTIISLITGIIVSLLKVA